MYHLRAVCTWVAFIVNQTGTCSFLRKEATWFLFTFMFVECSNKWTVDL